MTLRWEDPGPSRGMRQQHDWKAVAEQLKERPGQWALVAEGTDYLTGPVASGWLCLRRFDCETTRRKREDGTVALYARWPEV
jgi:hypothetical protein